jgi:transcriptional antiterminator RfaH
MFVQVDVDDIGLSIFQWMPHTLGLVCIGDEPAIVSDNILIEIKNRVDQITEAGGELFEGLAHGEPVTISDGPFAGYEAIFDTRIPGSERVRVLLQLLNDKRLIPLELRAGQLSRMK